MFSPQGNGPATYPGRRGEHFWAGSAIHHIQPWAGAMYTCQNTEPPHTGLGCLEHSTTQLEYAISVYTPHFEHAIRVYKTAVDKFFIPLDFPSSRQPASVPTSFVPLPVSMHSQYFCILSIQKLLKHCLYHPSLEFFVYINTIPHFFHSTAGLEICCPGLAGCSTSCARCKRTGHWSWVTMATANSMHLTGCSTITWDHTIQIRILFSLGVRFSARLLRVTWPTSAFSLKESFPPCISCGLQVLRISPASAQKTDLKYRWI